jgi:hypothetical protein
MRKRRLFSEPSKRKCGRHDLSVVQLSRKGEDQRTHRADIRGTDLAEIL